MFPAVYTRSTLTVLLVVHSLLYRVTKTQLIEIKWQLHDNVTINERSHRRTWILSRGRYCTEIRAYHLQPRKCACTAGKNQGYYHQRCARCMRGSEYSQ
jgi:hypothetical protein